MSEVGIDRDLVEGPVEDPEGIPAVRPPSPGTRSQDPRPAGPVSPAPDSAGVAPESAAADPLPLPPAADPRGPDGPGQPPVATLPPSLNSVATAATSPLSVGSLLFAGSHGWPKQPAEASVGDAAEPPPALWPAQEAPASGLVLDESDGGGVRVTAANGTPPLSQPVPKVPAPGGRTLVRQPTAAQRPRNARSSSDMLQVGPAGSVGSALAAAGVSLPPGARSPSAPTAPPRLPSSAVAEEVGATRDQWRQRADDGAVPRSPMPTIEITIGRVEVRTATPTRSQATAPPIPAVSTLDDYLLRRARAR
jgi:hypothetical protein